MITSAKGLFRFLARLERVPLPEPRRTRQLLYRQTARSSGGGVQGTLPATEKPSIAICPECGGDGFLIYTGDPGTYSPSCGNRLPFEKQVVCPECNGPAEIEPDPDDELDELDELDDLEDDLVFDPTEFTDVQLPFR